MFVNIHYLRNKRSLLFQKSFEFAGEKIFTARAYKNTSVKPSIFSLKVFQRFARKVALFPANQNHSPKNAIVPR